GASRVAHIDRRHTGPIDKAGKSVLDVHLQRWQDVWDATHDDGRARSADVDDLKTGVGCGDICQPILDDDSHTGELPRQADPGDKGGPRERLDVHYGEARAAVREHLDHIGVGTVGGRTLLLVGQIERANDRGIRRVPQIDQVDASGAGSDHGDRSGWVYADAPAPQRE